MSDSFRMLVDVDATAEEAGELSRAVLARFREIGLITGDASGDCVLGGEGYRPGPAVSDIYLLQKNEIPFWKCRTNGVEPRIGRHFNEWAIGEACNGLSCPRCNADFESLDDAFKRVTGKPFGEWIRQTGPALVPCPQCGRNSSITEWQCKPLLGFGNLSFTFWNWPPLDSSSFKIDIKELVEEITHHSIISTHGHI
jgi:hypothetical protein